MRQFETQQLQMDVMRMSGKQSVQAHAKVVVETQYAHTLTMNNKAVKLDMTQIAGTTTIGSSTTTAPQLLHTQQHSTNVVMAQVIPTSYIARPYGMHPLVLSGYGGGTCQ